MGSEFYVYMLFHPVSGLPCYVGKGKGHRCFVHNKNRSHNPHLKNILRKHGELPCVIIHSSITEKMAFDYEIALIAAIGRKCDGGPLVNLSIGGDGPSGTIHSKESNKKRSLAQKGRVKSEQEKIKLSTALKGRVFRQETINKMQQAHIGKTPSEETRKKMSQTRIGVSRPRWIIEKLREANIGKIVSEETRAKISAAGKNRKRLPESIQKHKDKTTGRKWWTTPNGDWYISFEQKSPLDIRGRH